MWTLAAAAAVTAVLALPLVSAQQPAPAGCFKLTGTQKCKGLEEFSVLSNPDFSDVASFDKYLNGQSATNTSYVDAFRKDFDCPTWDGLGERWHQSTLCYYLVQLSGCPDSKAPTFKPLCKSQCTQFVDSMSSIFKNASSCAAAPAATPLNNRAIADPQKSPYSAFCNTLATDDPKTCAVGLLAEEQTCGFSSTEQATAFCAAKPSEPCCSKVAEARDSALKGIAQSLNPVNNLPWIASGAALGAMSSSTSAAEPPKSDIEPGPNRLGTVIRADDADISASASVTPGNKFMAAARNTRQSVFGNAAPRESGFFQLKVVEQYNAQLGDELDLFVGDVITIEEEFDDGWAVGRNEASGEVGAFPMSCLASLEFQGEQRQSEIRTRTQSLYASDFNGMR
ncbi:hypothetical protein DFS34DRAFT_702535 [Phlyctochytrium arcticum]|nr:hypothetical protein DFS34DRAFT_702535 [Phlyctochytrium arcticum]